jgi:hypothetical protein
MRKRGNDMKKQHGMSIYGFIYVLVTVGIAGYIGLKAGPNYLEYYSVKNILASMALEEAKNMENVKEIRNAYDRRATIGYVTVVRGEDLEVTKDGGETVISASWSVKVPLFASASLVLDFNASSK